MKALSIKGRACYVLRWKDRAGNWHDKTTEIPNTPCNRSRAAKAASDQEAILAGERAEAWTWAEYDEVCKEEWLAGLSSGYAITWDTATKCLCTWRTDVGLDLPDPLAIDADLLHEWVAWMRRQGFAKATIRSYLGIVHGV